ncbi:MAG: hypothetical protein KatS3mg131_0347 [Candidatus Tectimicrobiota bacterium]|nr:MAG: hypothetical protein KatS3mg131_0347 [Candidatus Tectomicrobia bacterium]
MQHRTWHRLGLTLAAVAVLFAVAQAQEPYRVGLSAALTGRGAETYAPVSEAIRLYVARLNARGGIHGHPVELLVEDNVAEPSRAAAHAKKFVSQDGVLLMLNASLSSTYPPMIHEAKRAGVPLFFAGSVCPREVYPPADPLLFCSTAFAARYDSEFALDFIKETAAGPVKLALVSMSIPISRGEVDYAEQLAPSRGIEPVSNQSIPPPTPNYAPFAAKIKAAGATWVYAWAPWVTQVKTFEALRQLGWQGKFLAYAHINAEEELARLQDEHFYVFGANAFFSHNLPVHQEILQAAAQGTMHPPTQLAEGWVAGMVLEAVLAGVSWPPTPAKVLAAMNRVRVDTRGLRGGPLEWTPTNHFRTTHYYRVYRWDRRQQGAVLAKDWTAVAIK